MAAQIEQRELAKAALLAPPLVQANFTIREHIDHFAPIQT